MWTKNSSKKTKKKYILPFIAAMFCIAAMFLWIKVIAPELTKLPHNFSYEANVDSIDSFYDSQIEEFQTEIKSNNKLYYQTEESEEGVLLIKNIFNVRQPSGENIFSVERLYGIDPFKRAHLKDYGDENRTGYLFGPRNTKKGENFIYWHINYNEPASMHFVGEEELYGLTVYRYEANYQADQTENLAYLPEVNKTRGVNLDIHLTLWIEPTSGWLVKFQDRSTGYFYDLKTKERQEPWNKFSNTYGETEIQLQVERAKEEKTKIILIEKTIPLILLGLGILFFTGSLLSHFKKIGKFLAKSITIVTFISGLLVSLGMWWLFSKNVENQLILKFQSDTHQMVSLMEQRLNLYKNVLFGAQGIFAASDEVTEEEWSTYVEELRIKENYPGVSGMGFIKRVTDEEKANFPYPIYPEVQKSDYYPVTYTFQVVPSATTSKGFDLSSEQERSKALMTSAQNNEPEASGVVTGITNKVPTFSIYAPIYEKNRSIDTPAERMQALKGFVAIGFRINELFEKMLLESSFEKNIDTKVYDTASLEEGSMGKLLFDSKKPENSESNGSIGKIELSREETIFVAGRSWTFHFKAQPTYQLNVTDRFLPLGVLITGTLISFLLAGVFYTLASSRERAKNLAHQATLKLQIQKTNLQEAKNKDEAILKGLGEGLIVANKEGDVTLVNKAFETILGWSFAEVQGKKWPKVLQAIDEDGKEIRAQKRLITQVLKTGKTMRSSLSEDQFFYVKKDKTSIPVAISVTPILDEKEIVGAIEVFRDISKEKEIDKAKTELVSLASHQLRSPLSTISWYVEMLLAGDAGKLKEEQKKYLEEIYAGNRRMVNLVNALLNVSRIDLGTFSIEPVPTDIIALSKDIVRGLESKIFERKLGVQEKYDQTIDLLNADPKLLRIIIENLLSNAIKYTPEKGYIDFSIEKRAKDILIKIKDTGYGIPKKDQPKIFSKLYRADNIREHAIEGTGLGLYIVKNVVNQSGGEIWFESKENKGTCFYVSLPLKGFKKKKGSRSLT